MLENSSVVQKWRRDVFLEEDEHLTEFHQGIDIPLFKSGTGPAAYLSFKIKTVWLESFTEGA